MFALLTYFDIFGSVRATVNFAIFFTKVFFFLCKEAACFVNDKNFSFHFNLPHYFKFYLFTVFDICAPSIYQRLLGLLLICYQSFGN